MTTDDSHTRRDCLRSISAAGAVIGGGTLGVSSASAGGRPDDRTPTPVDPTDIALETVCVDADHDAALFCVENDADRLRNSSGSRRLSRRASSSSTARRSASWATSPR
ncbi:hypothetical protein [Natrinema sp. 1APR25-10V2]|uniref:hypothetical protein n=1 Tax=Natrinema sp. 1APR25-10V2 TaxID=2951081 RepID=UPI002876C891|nr:hypothetical protein [Natrinema sp. 1APR25-10V2]MDS0476743.1 hypothetical protein [Natrinema sp. 1APR25-10V2]